MSRAAVVVNPTKLDDDEAFRKSVRQVMDDHGWDEPLWQETTPEDPGRGQAAWESQATAPERRKRPAEPAQGLCYGQRDRQAKAMRVALAGRAAAPCTAWQSGSGSGVHVSHEFLRHGIAPAFAGPGTLGRSRVSTKRRAISASLTFSA
jgi:hypothetical protein